MFKIPQHHENDVIDLQDQFPARLRSARTLEDQRPSELLLNELKNRSVPGRHPVISVSEEAAASSAGTGRCPWSPSSDPAGKILQLRRRTSPNWKWKQGWKDGGSTHLVDLFILPLALHLCIKTVKRSRLVDDHHDFTAET